MNSESAEILRSPFQEVGVTRAREKNHSREKKKIRPHFSGTPQTERAFFDAAASNEHMLN